MTLTKDLFDQMNPSEKHIIKKAGADMHFAFQLRLVEGAVIYFPTFAVSSTW